MDEIVQLRGQILRITVGDIGHVEPGGGTFPVAGFACREEAFHQPHRGVEIERSGRPGLEFELLYLVDVGLAVLRNCDALRRDGSRRQTDGGKQQDQDHAKR